MQFLIQCLSHTSPILRTQPAQETEYLTEQNRKFYWTGLYIPNIQMYKQAQREGVTPLWKLESLLRGISSSSSLSSHPAVPGSEPLLV